MSTRRKRPVASFDAAEQLPRNTLPLLPLRLLLFSVLPRKSNFLSAKPCGYLLALIFFCLFFIVPAIVDAAVVYWNPWVTKTTTNSATINWYGSNTKAGEVEYATSSYYNEHTHFDKTKVSHIDSAYQHVQLTDLEPNTEYTYRVTTSDATPHVFRVSKFRTMPASGPFTFIVISDTHAQEGRFKYVAAAIEKETDVLFILDGGDYTGHDSNDEWTLYFTAADKMLAKFAIFNTIGNHEYHSSAPETPALHYHGAFDIPPNGALNYSFDCAGIRFVILNSPDPSIEGDPSPTLPLALSQAPWLRDQLDNNMLGTFTIHHHPIWDSGRTTINADLKPWEDLYHAYPISATFSGHTHTYQRYSVKGIPYFVVANAGGGFSNLTPPYAEGWITGETRRLGYLRVTVDPANNTATATEIFVASVDDTAVPEIITVYPTPITYDTLTFSLKPTSLKPTGGGSGCFIATAAFGSSLAGQVQILRQFRDMYLLTNDFGRQFVSWYYRNGPDAANYIKDKPLLKAAVRVALYPLIGVSLMLMSGILPYLILVLIGFILFFRFRSKKLSAA
jgi:hypothetical protein